MLVQFVHAPTCTLKISKATLRLKWCTDLLWWLIDMTVLRRLTSVSTTPSHLDCPRFSGETHVYSLSALLKPLSLACSSLCSFHFNSSSQRSSSWEVNASACLSSARPVFFLGSNEALTSPRWPLKFSESSHKKAFGPAPALNDSSCCCPCLEHQPPPSS